MIRRPSSENSRDETPKVAGEAASKAGKAKPAQVERTCIMVLGMHRSGTSALTRAISLLGAELPKNMLGANPTNETGHWEPVRLMELHDRMLAEADSRWGDWRPFKPADLGAPRLRFYKAEIARLIDEEYDSAPLFVLKEPRISRFVPLYADILKRMRIDVRYVQIERNPLAVIASLAKRDRFTKSFSALLWLRHQLEAEHATRGRPRVFLSYEGMLDDWRAGIEAIANALKIDWPLPKTEWQAKLSNHFSQTHQHHVASLYQLETAPAIDDWVKQAYAATRTLEKDADDGAAMLQLDAVREGFDSLNPLFADAFFSEMSARENAAAEHLLRQRGATDEFAMELEKTRLEAAAREIQLTQQLREVLHLADEQAAEFAKVQEQYLQLMHQKEALQRLTEMQAADRDQYGLKTAAREADLTAQANYEARRANDAERRIQGLMEESERLKVAISQIESSPLWKATYPARYLKSLLKSEARGTGDA